MFNLFKKKIDLEIVVSDFADYLLSVRNSVDELTKNAGIAPKKNYDREAAALAYIIGWLAIQTSHLNAPEKLIFRRN
jgi:hypothetical protein